MEINVIPAKAGTQRAASAAQKMKSWMPASGGMTRSIILYFAWLGLFFLIFVQSWVSEDAYITFRVIDNWLHGYGLRWNIDERVQVYTHPLWLLLHLPFATLWPNLFQLNIALSLVCSSVAVGIVLLTFRKSLGITLACFLLPLFLSKAFIEYASSGLETSLSFLLFAMLGFVVMHWRERLLFPFALSLLSALLLLNRLDHIVLIAPLLIALYCHHEKQFLNFRGVLMVFCGALPLLAWFGFSLIYYGFFFPNTKYAKLDTGLPLYDYVAQGLQYSFIWLTQDTASVLVTITALIFGIRQKSSITRMLALGIILNIAYVITIGGDYMMGRFYAVIFFAAGWLLLASVPPFKPDKLFVAAIGLMLAYATSYSVRDIRDSCDECVPIRGRVMDARRTFGGNKLFTSYWPLKMRTEGEYKFGRDGKKIAEDAPPVKTLMYIGMMGYYAGPKTHIIDELGLCDPLLARLPAMKGRPFYVAHYKRAIPKGYTDAVKNGTLGTMDKNLARYYDKLRLITQGDIWDKERLATIIRFNSGQYDADKYAFLNPPR